MAVNMLILFCLLYLVLVRGALMPENEASIEMINPLMPNNEQSVKDCPYSYYPLAKQYYESSSFGEPYQDKSYAHVVKLDTVDEACLGAIVDAGHVLTTKSCALKQPKTISFHNSSLPRSGVRSTTYHLSLNAALLQLSSRLVIDHQIIPACFWSASIDTGFPSLQHVYRDPHTGALTSHVTNCHLSEREQCSKRAKRIEEGLLQIQAISNYRTHPFIVSLANEQNGTVVDVPTIADWIQQETGSSVQGVDCALLYARFREYSSRIVEQHSATYRSIELQNGHFRRSTNNGYEVSIGFYLDDPLKEADIIVGCYGTLVHRHYVLTTASCIADYVNYTLIIRLNQVTKLIPADDIELHRIEDSQYLEEVYVSQTYLHPNFSASPLKNDLALLLLQEANLSFQQHFKPACLWVNDKFEVHEFQTHGHGPQVLAEHYNQEIVSERMDKSRQSELHVISKVLEEGCQLNLTSHQICVGDAVTIVPGSCEMNRGAAMSREIWTLDSFLYDYVFGLGSEGQNCGFNTPAIFTKVSPYISWIDSIIFGDSARYNDSGVYYGDECHEQNKTFTVCLELSECTGVLNRIRNGQITDNSKISCGFENETPLTCCSIDDFVMDEDITATALELERCPDLYAELRGKRLPNNQRGGLATAVGLLKSATVSHTCDATVISKKFLVTSASCYARFGFYDAITCEIGHDDVQHLTIEEGFIHPKYNELNLVNNIAVVKLREPVKINKQVIPACLWSNHTHIPFLLEVVGKITVNVSAYPIYQKICQSRLGTSLSSSELCIASDKFSGSVDSMLCNDTGTGVFNYFAYGLHELQISYLVGVFNHGTGCTVDSTGVWTRMSNHFAWIKSIVYRNV